ncbi:type I 3-dehydroquinate dehydratase [Liquorilactobacillus capillatus]|uniref:3-dehydroquinate dehydratase n=1 Tax=Liquorilactobacillus capillatus DSM 19910 TaxID=1423731 RepID=A0A0R1M760_9LACO|nr:type I 3-dehydroquinate dehydratase [Liquorilactobacillus capillatus]KRL00618.1 3-dehydroquinate dehydratase [Liquorilactobacillus capillatus DSM 19910]
MPKKLQVKQTIFTSGETKIAVSLTSSTQIQLRQEAQQVVTAKPDVVEWRIDFYTNVLDEEEYLITHHRLKQILGDDIILLTTFRTQQEGGVRKLTDKQYFKLVNWIILNHLTDMLDLELMRSSPEITHTISLAHQKGIKVILSKHDFQRTPTQTEIVVRLKQMAALQADIAKIAVMPHNADDVLTLLNATRQADLVISIPLITMSMGQLGKISRLSGPLFGSVLSFAALAKTSAPGQLSVAALRQALHILSYK